MEIREKLVMALREEFFTLTEVHETGRIEKIANLYAAILAIDFVQQNGGPKEPEPSKYIGGGLVEV